MTTLDEPSDYSGRMIRKAIPYREILDVIGASLDKCKSRARDVKANRKQLQADGIYERKVSDVRIERLILDQIRWRLSHLRYATPGEMAAAGRVTRRK